MKTVILYSIIILAVTTIGVVESTAIPAFARKYDMTCATCHAPFPKLKSYGEDFAGNAFQLADKEPPRYFKETGDSWLLLNREVPLALRLEGYARWQPETEGRSDFQTPYLLKILSGGQIAKDIAYYFYFFFNERGEVAGVEDAFIMFNNVFGSELDIYAGQFQVSDPLFKRELRLSLEDYQIYRVKPGESIINLTYDRGLMLTYALPTKTDITLEILNGSGIGAADSARNFDRDKYKNAFLRISQDVSGTVRIGGFGYYGKEEQTGRTNTLWMAGPDLTLSAGPVEVNLQYVERRDDNPLFAAVAQEVRTRGAMGELIITPDGDKSRWYGVALYNWVEMESGLYKYNAATGHLSYLISRNLRLIGEYTYDIEVRANKFSIGFVSAF